MERPESKPALDLLPYDVWAYVFNHVGPDNEIREIAAARRTCKLFNDFLEPKAFQTLWSPWLDRPTLQLLAICHRQSLGRMVKKLKFEPRGMAESYDLRPLQRLREAMIQVKMLDQTNIDRRLKLDILDGLNEGNSDAIYAVAFCLCPEIEALELTLNPWRSRPRKRLLKRFGSTLHGRLLQHIAVGANAAVPQGISHIKSLHLDASDEAFSSWVYLINMADLERLHVDNARLSIPPKTKVPIVQSNLRQIKIDCCEVDTSGARHLIQSCKNMETLDVSLPRVTPDESYELSLPQVGDFLRQHRPPLNHLAWHYEAWVYRNQSNFVYELPFGDLRCLDTLTILTVDEPHLFGNPSHRTRLSEILPSSLQRLRIDGWQEFSHYDKAFMAWNDEQCNSVVADPSYPALQYVEMFRGNINLPRQQPHEGWAAWAATFPRGVSFLAPGYLPASDERWKIDTYNKNMALLDEAASRADDIIEGDASQATNH